MNWEQLLTNIRREALVTGVPSIDERGFSLLCRLTAAFQPKRVLEIGTANGYTAFGMLSVMDAAATLTTIELDPERVTRARRWAHQANVSDRLFVLEGDAAEVLLHLSPPFDFVYLDAAKGQYLANLEAVLPLLADGAMVVADDIFHDGLLNKPWNEIPRRQRTIVKRLQEFLARLQQPPFYDTRIEATGNGMVIARFRKEFVNDHQ